MSHGVHRAAYRMAHRIERLKKRLTEWITERLTDRLTELCTDQTFLQLERATNQVNNGVLMIPQLMAIIMIGRRQEGLMTHFVYQIAVDFRERSLESLEHSSLEFFRLEKVL